MRVTVDESLGPISDGPLVDRRRKVSRKAIIALIALIVVVGLPTLIPIDPYRIDLDAVLAPPSARHFLGTDETGRDVFTRLIRGARATLGVGAAGALLAVVIGTVIGAIAGLVGSWLDAVLMRIVDFALAFPSLIAILLATAIFPGGVTLLILLIGLTGWMPVARLMRGEVRRLLGLQFIEASRALGSSQSRLLSTHLLPHTYGVLAVAGLLQLNRAILAEATISFLGLGVQPPEPTWGNMLIGAQSFLFTAPWLAMAPGVALTATLLAICLIQPSGSMHGHNLSGNSLRLDASGFKSGQQP